MIDIEEGAKNWAKAVELEAKLKAAQLEHTRNQEMRAAKQYELLIGEQENKREWQLWQCAQTVMNGMLAFTDDWDDVVVARKAYDFAEALMAERDRRRGGT